ncbi:AAA family ATPase [Frankia sp. AgB32]|uniref:HelD family protein n=1 Tax=Frankia sp. AgB32 TaxID=631119 RepID=UPI00200D2ED0|nr:AAA family ATPase [Frankia sp. AgB32]MCK9895986.1 AAA family ATPase [Frankia sp. AgB32]
MSGRHGDDGQVAQDGPGGQDGFGPGPASGLASELAAERDYLARSRRALGGMRQEAAGTRVAEGDAEVDKVTNEYLRVARARRVLGLAGGDGTPLFFARLDYVDGGDRHGGGDRVPVAVAGRRFYLGRRHVRESAGDDPLVVDWRTDVARPFYRAHRADPMGVSRRRRFGYDGGELTAFEDEPLTIEAAAADPVGPAPAARTPAPVDGLVAREIERPRSGPMRDIVATIQPEQDEIVRAGLDLSLCVQGAPGTGKTAVGLHRAAYLLFAHRERLARAGVLVVGPNRAFLGYIAAVLPSLGESTVRHATLDDLLDPAPTTSTRAGAARRAEPAATATLKGDARLADVTRRALHDGLRPPTGPIAVHTSLGRWTVGEQEFTDLHAETLAALHAGTLRYGAARDRLAARLAASVRRRAEAGGHHLTDGALRTLARGRSVRDAVEAVWPAVDPAVLVRRLLTDPALLARAAAGLLDPAEQATLLAAAPPGPVRAPHWSAADLFLLDEVRHLVEGTAGVGHLIVDEAQDLAPMQCRALARRCADGSMTVLGDLAQGTTPWAATSWPAQLTHLGRPGAHLEVLTRGFRVPAQILAFAGRLLADIAPDLPPPTSARATRGALAVLATADVPAAVTEHVRAALTRDGSLAVIAADPDVAALAAALRAAALPVDELTATGSPTRFCLAPASLAKGLEFDHVIAVEPAAIVAAESRPALGLRRLYVVLTRAVSALTVVHAHPLPAALRTPGMT